MSNWMRSIEDLDEVRRFWRSDFGHTYAVGWVESRKENYGVEDPMINRIETAITGHASLFWIASDMLRLAEHAAETMPLQELLSSDLPSPFGFAVFERPWVIMDARDQPLNIGAMAWGPFVDATDGRAVIAHPGEPNGVWVSFYTNTDFPDAYEMPKYPGIAMPRLMFEHYDTYRFGMPPYRDDMLMRTLEGETPAKQDPRFRMQRMLPFSLWTLIKQPIVVVEDTPPPRFIRRRLEREGSSLAVSTIRVVTLRREQHEKNDDADHRHVDWSHRWINSGYWRTMPAHWLPDQANRLQWVPAHVKGPADKPLVIKKTVHKLVR